MYAWFARLFAAHRRRLARGQRGITLVEILVAMGVLSLVGLGAVGAFRIMASSAGAASTAALRSADAGAVQRMVDELRSAIAVVENAASAVTVIVSSANSSQPFGYTDPATGQTVKLDKYAVRYQFVSGTLYRDVGNQPTWLKVGVPVIQNPAFQCKAGTRKADYDAQLAAYKAAHPEDPFGYFFKFKPAVCYADPPTTDKLGAEYQCSGTNPPECEETAAWSGYYDDYRQWVSGQYWGGLINSLMATMSQPYAKPPGATWKPGSTTSVSGSAVAVAKMSALSFSYMDASGAAVGSANPEKVALITAVYTALDGTQGSVAASVIGTAASAFKNKYVGVPHPCDVDPNQCAGGTTDYTRADRDSANDYAGPPITERTITIVVSMTWPDGSTTYAEASFTLTNGACTSGCYDNGTTITPEQFQQIKDDTLSGNPDTGFLVERVEGSSATTEITVNDENGNQSGQTETYEPECTAGEAC